MAEIITVEEAVATTISDFDFDVTPVIRWRGVKEEIEGACCYVDPDDPDGTTQCINHVTPQSCVRLNGDFAPGAICDSDPCPGACCEDDGAGGLICEDLTHFECDDIGGQFRGINTACDDDPNPCIVGVCCLPTAGCFDQSTYPSQEDCENAGGEWFTDAHCDDVPDPCAGACCLIDAEVTCDDLTEVDCDGISGGFQGIGTTCADVPDPCAPTGACCQDSDCFEDMTEADCTDVGGDYVGDDTTCTPNPCVTGVCCASDGSCTEEFPGDCTGVYGGDDTTCSMTGACCPSISLTCDSAAASKSKCGFSDPDSNTVYHDRGRAETWTVISDIGGGQFCHGDPKARIDFIGTGSVTFTTSDVIDPTTCTETDSICTDNGGMITITRSQTGEHANVCDDLFPACQTHSFFPTCGSITPIGIGGRYFGDPCGPIGFTGPVIFSAFGAEYTTGELIAEVEAMLVYSGDYTGGACASSRFLSVDEKTYSVQRSRPRFTFGTTLVNFTLSYDEVFTPADGGGTVTTHRAVTLSAGTTVYDGPELLEPATNGTISIGNIACTPAA